MDKRQTDTIVPPQQQGGNMKLPPEELEGGDIPVARIARTNWTLNNEQKVAIEAYFRLRGTAGALSAHDHAVMQINSLHTFSKYVHTTFHNRLSVPAVAYYSHIEKC